MTLGPIQRLVQRAQKALFLGAKQLNVKLTYTYCAGKNKWRYNSAPPTPSWRTQVQFTFTSQIRAQGSWISISVVCTNTTWREYTNWLLLSRCYTFQTTVTSLYFGLQVQLTVPVWWRRCPLALVARADVAGTMTMAFPQTQHKTCVVSAFRCA